LRKRCTYKTRPLLPVFHASSDKGGQTFAWAAATPERNFFGLALPPPRASPTRSGFLLLEHARVGNLGLDVPDRLLALADEVIE
jgi:hypothetical protein